MAVTRAPVRAPDQVDPAPAPTDPHEAGRLVYLDNLRLFLIAGVIVAHCATAYIGGGAWVDAEEANGVNAITFLAILGLVGALFWIGVFFLISGMLVPRALAHRGAGTFLRDRLIRLGVPFLVFLFLIMPLMRYGAYATKATHPMPVWTYMSRHVLDLDPGPLWFLAALLVITTAYAIWWSVRPCRVHRPRRLRPVYLVALALAIGIASFGVHLALPAFTHQYLDLHFWQWPQYIILFWFGAVCAEQGWLTALPDRLWRWCLLALLLATAAIPVVAVTGGALTGQAETLTGGWHWQALAIGQAEGVLAVAGSLWILDLFRRRFAQEGPAVRQLARSAFGAYLLQAPVLTGFAILLEPTGFSVELRFLLLAPATLAVSFGLAWLLVVRFRLANRIL